MATSSTSAAATAPSRWRQTFSADGERAWPMRREHAALAAILVLSGLLEFVRLAQNGYANDYYSAAVRSMLRSLHNFFYVAADPNGLITVDKPPLGLWLQALSAKIFGFSALSLLVPEGICAVVAVALLYRIVVPRFGKAAGLISAFTLAVFPSFVAVSRDSGLDPLLILLMLAACGAGLAAIDSGRLRQLIWCGVLVALAFNTKALAAFLVVPGIAVGYLVCAPGSLRRRIAALAVAGLVMAAVAASWSVVVELTPASQRPFIGSTSSNSELSLDFGYNGFGRVGGEQGGPGSTKKYPADGQPPLVRPGVDLPRSALELSYLAAHPRVRHLELPRAHHHARVAHGRHRAKEIPFASTHLTPVRILGRGLGDQAGWDVVLALLGLIALVIAVRRRHDRRAPGLFVLGGWFLVELLTLDFSSGIVHPYYASALGPGLAVMVGAGAVALGSLVRSANDRTALLGYVLSVLAIGGTVGVQLFLIGHYGDPTWWRFPLVLIASCAVVAIPLARARARTALGIAIAAVLVAPMLYSFSVWLAPVDGTFPTAGPHNHAGYGGYGRSRLGLRATRSLIHFLDTHGATKPYALLTESSDQASSYILLGLSADAEGGYNTTDPALSNARLASLVARHEARYFLIGGPYDVRGGNDASDAARLVCPEIPQLVWASGGSSGGSWLVDCGGRSAELRYPHRWARRFLVRHPRLHYTL
jgi:4-amino-4-deoxy-L-arabinose transferase-like glycosyltransferase